MGLDISPNGPHFSYGDFSQWLDALEEEEFDLLDSPLRPLIYPKINDDYTSEIPADLLKPMLPRLLEIARKWDEELTMTFLDMQDDEYEVAEYNYRKLVDFIDSALYCVEHGCAMVFS